MTGALSLENSLYFCHDRAGLASCPSDPSTEGKGGLAPLGDHTGPCLGWDLAVTGPHLVPTAMPLAATFWGPCGPGTPWSRPPSLDPPTRSLAHSVRSAWDALAGPPFVKSERPSSSAPMSPYQGSSPTTQTLQEFTCPSSLLLDRFL